jgi:protein TonB
LAGVIACHVAVLVAMLAAPDKAQPITPPKPLSVNLIELQEEPAKTELKPEPPRPLPPRPVDMPVPAPPVLNVERLVQQDPPRAVQVAEPLPVVAPVPEVLPPPEPAVVAEIPKPAPPPPPPVIEPRFDADYLDNPKPPYPKLSSKLGETGKVFLRVYVKTDGTVKELELHKSSGFERLDRSAMNTVQNWRFVPARQGSKPVDGWVIVPINFTFGS